jgi:hypothetical protein
MNLFLENTEKCISDLISTGKNPFVIGGGNEQS